MQPGQGSDRNLSTRLQLLLNLGFILIGKFKNSTSSVRASPGGSVVKNVLAMQETQVPSLGQEDPLEKEMAIHSSILARKIPRTEEPGGLQSMGSQRVRHGASEHTHTHWQ